MDPTFVRTLHDLLLQTTSNDTATLKAATTRLSQDFYKNPSCIPALVSIIAESPEQPVRQLAAVELRKRVSNNSGTLWTGVPSAEREVIKNTLPQVILAESNKLVRNSAARVVAAIATIEIPAGGWPQLLPLLQQSCRSPAASTREVASFMLFAVLENIVEGFQSSLPELFQLFEQLLRDPESVEVQIITVRSLGVVAQYIDSGDKAELKAFQNLLPSIIQVIGQCVQRGHEDGARQLFDVLETLLILEVPLLSKHIPDLCQFLLQCGGNAEFDGELRVLALNALSWTVQYKKSKVQSHNLAPAILEGLMPIASEEAPEDADDDAPSRAALRIIDGLATNLPPGQVFPALRNLIVQYFSSGGPANRRGAILALGVAVEGCSEFMTPLMSQVWPIIDAGLQDADPTVRKAACIAVSCLCEWLQDDCAARHAELLPAILRLISDPVTQKAACTALDALLELLHDVIDQYLSPIMERLAVLLESSPTDVKSVVIGAIGSAAHSSKEKFLPYFAPTMGAIGPFLQTAVTVDETELRGITMDAIGTFAEAVGKDNFQPYFAQMMEIAFEGVRSDSARLHECSFLFFSVMARLFGEEFAPYLPRVVPPLLESCRQAEEGESKVEVTAADTSAFASGSSAANAISLVENADGDTSIEDIDLEKMMSANTAIAVEKEIAADTIGSIFAATQAHFLPYMESAVLELVELLNHYYEGIRKSAVDSLLEIVRTFYDLSEHEEEWQPGSNSPSCNLNPRVLELIGHVLEPLLEAYDGEDNKSVVASLCMGLAETINKIGPGFVRNASPRLCRIALEVLEQKSFCQQDPDQDDEEEAPEEQAEYDSVLISSAGDLVAALANALGSEFEQAFETFFPHISKFTNPGRSATDRASAVGTLAEIVAGMKSSITPFTERLLEVFYRALNDAEPEVQSNGAFAVGLLVEHSGVDLSSQYIQILTALRPLFQVSESSTPTQLSAKDNATGAVARLISKGAAHLPLDQVLPIFIGALPLKNDFLENRPVFKALFHLFQSNAIALYPFLDQLLPVFFFVLNPESGKDQVGDEVRAELIGLIAVLNAEVPEKIAATGLSAFLPGA